MNSFLKKQIFVTQLRLRKDGITHIVNNSSNINFYICVLNQRNVGKKTQTSNNQEEIIHKKPFGDFE